MKMNLMNFAFVLFVSFLMKNEFVIGQMHFSPIKSHHNDDNNNNKHAENKVEELKNDIALKNSNQASQSIFYNSMLVNSLSKENKNKQTWTNDKKINDARRIDIENYFPKTKNPKRLKPIINNGYTLDLNIDVFRSTVILFEIFFYFSLLMLNEP